MTSWIIGWIIATLLAATIMRYISVGLHKWKPQFEPMSWQFCIIFSAAFQFIWALL